MAGSCSEAPAVRVAVATRAVLIVALQLVDQVARLADAQLVGRLEPEAVTEQAHEVDPPTGREIGRAHV